MRLNFTGNPRVTQIIIAALVVLTSWFGCKQAKADDATFEEDRPKFLASAGELVISSNIPASHALRVGMESGPWQVSIVTHGEEIFSKPEASYVLEPNMGACGTWAKGLRKWSIGWGACLWEHGDWAIGDADKVTEVISDRSLLYLNDDGIQLTANIVVRRTFGEQDRLYVEMFHASTGGSTHYNRGKNFFLVGVRM